VAKEMVFNSWQEGKSCETVGMRSMAGRGCNVGVWYTLNGCGNH